MRLMIVASILAVALSSCVSTRDPYLNAPTQIVNSQRKAEDVDYCLANAYAVVHPVVRQKRDDGSIRLAFRNAMTGGLRFAVNIVPENGQSRVEFWKGQDGIKWVTGCL
jgi:hypothetical protein